MTGRRADRIAQCTELLLLQELLNRDALNLEGLAYGFWYCTHPNNITTPGPPAVLREQVHAQFVAALARTTGMPESYWADRPIVDVPDDLSSLGDTE